MLNIPQIKLIEVAISKTESNSYISDENEQYACDSHAHIINLFLK